MSQDRETLGRAIAGKLRAHAPALSRAWSSSVPVRHFVLDDLLPAELPLELSRKFPEPRGLMLYDDLSARKRVGVDLARYDPLVGESLFAFHHPEVVAEIAAVTGLAGLRPDPTFYASGISVMGQGDFLNPHIDNSHDGDQKLYRSLNLLYYVSPDWALEDGGNFELWDPAVKEGTTIVSKFNRLIVMQTSDLSWHSVSLVKADRTRRCVSNYYFSPASPEGRPYRNVTTFTGRPEERFKRIVLGADALVKNWLGKAFPWLLTRNKHRLKPVAPQNKPKNS